jgi:hypothetical protein
VRLLYDPVGSHAHPRRSTGRSATRAARTSARSISTAAQASTPGRDTQLRIVGDGAAVLQAVLMTDWYNAVNEDLFSAAYYPLQAAEPIKDRS